MADGGVAGSAAAAAGMFTPLPLASPARKHTPADISPEASERVAQQQPSAVALPDTARAWHTGSSPDRRPR